MALRRLFALAALLGLAVVTAGAKTSAGQRWWEHVLFLADDKLEGRNTGSPGHARAAEYVAQQFERYGAKPGGTQGYLQPVEFASRRIREPESGLWLVRDGHAVPLELGQDANFQMGIEPADTLEAPAVFVGYGLSIPGQSWDDLAGLDLRGKIAVCMQGGPSTIPGPLRAHAQSTQERWRHLHEAGAVGLAYIANPRFMDIPWSRSTLARLYPSMSPVDPKLDQTPGQKFSIRVNPEHAEAFFVGSGHTFAEVLALADREVALPRFPLGVSIRAKVRYERTRVTSQNVVGILPGSDATLRNEYVVLSAHLDHLGIGGAIAGDSIYNGAMDNASGIATLIEIARLAQESKAPLRRSLVLLAVTGEEKGLQGSRYFATYPTVKSSDLVADVNMDMFLPIVPFKILTVYGLNESDLGDWVRPVAQRFHVRVQDDPEPGRNLFIRSDQYSFVRRGVPALAFKFGFDPGTPEAQIFKDWLTARYHAPSDDTQQPVDIEGAAQFTRLLLDFCRDIANRPERPHWKPDSFFKRFATPPTGTH